MPEETIHCCCHCYLFVARGLGVVGEGTGVRRGYWLVWGCTLKYLKEVFFIKQMCRFWYDVYKMIQGLNDL